MPHRERTPAEERALRIYAEEPNIDQGLPPGPAPEPVEPESVVEQEPLAPTPPPAEEEEEKTPRELAEEELEALEPKSAHKKWIFKDEEGNEFNYTQKPLSYFGKMEFFSVLGNAVDLALANEGMNMASLFGQRGFDAASLMDAESFVRTVSRLVVFAPDLLQDSFSIWLNVPRGERAAIKSLMRETLDDDAAQEIIEVFIDQNMEAMSRFFLERIPQLSKRAKRRMPAGVSRQLKPSKPSQPSIQSQ